MYREAAMTRSASMEKDWFLNKTQELIRALAGIAEYHNTLPDYRNEDDHGQPTREAIFSEYLTTAVYRATQIVAHEAEIGWKARDGDDILHQGQVGVRQVLKRYGLGLPWEISPVPAFIESQLQPKSLGSIDGLARHWTFATFDIARLLQGSITWDETMFDEHQQRELLKQAIKETYDYALHPQGWLLLAEPYGVGKSHLATAIIWEALNRGMVPLYLSALDIPDSYGSVANSEWLRAQPKLEMADLLVLDNLYLEDRLVWNRYIEKLLRARHREHLPTVLVSTRGQENLPAWLSNIVSEISVVASSYRQLPKRS
jgi:hypothetical protein